jgi:hypothetical protein
MFGPMSWKEKFREDKKAKLTVSVTKETCIAFKQICQEENTGTTQMIRSMVFYLLNEYADEIKDIA